MLHSHGLKMLIRILPVSVLFVGVCVGQMTRPGVWTTNSADPQRTGWQKNETVITKDSVVSFRQLCAKRVS